MENMARRLGWIPDHPDQRDFLFVRRRAAALPQSVNLRPYCPPVYDQGQLGSCTANAIAAAVGFARHRQGLAYLIPSRLFIYYNERVIENSVASDAGAMLRDGMKTIAVQGVCSEHRWPYNIDKFSTQPGTDCYESAVSHKTLTYLSVPQDQLSMLDCLAQGYPFVFGISVYDSFMSDATALTGDIPMPGPTETLQGGHALLAVGYDSSQNVILFRNSWGVGWGAGGYGTIPISYLMSPDLASDFWTVRLEQ